MSEDSKRKLLEGFVFGVRAHHLRFRAPGSLETTERFYLLIRKIVALEECKSPLEGSTECDESNFSGHRKGKYGWGTTGKTLDTGIYKRNGGVRIFADDNRQKETLLPLTKKHTAQRCLYYTDEYWAYASLKMRCDYVIVIKGNSRSKGREHINGIEGFRSYAKNCLYMYRGLPKKFMHLYLVDTSFRFVPREQYLLPAYLLSGHCDVIIQLLVIVVLNPSPRRLGAGPTPEPGPCTN